MGQRPLPASRRSQQHHRPPRHARHSATGPFQVDTMV
jgi:hypothetical protein